MSLALAIQGGDVSQLSSLFGAPGTLEAVGLFLARTSALLLLTPLIGSGAQFHGYKIALVVTVTSVMCLVQGLPAVVVDS